MCLRWSDANCAAVRARIFLPVGILACSETCSAVDEDGCDGGGLRTGRESRKETW